jgi:hypothetical protein
MEGCPQHLEEFAMLLGAAYRESGADRADLGCG